MLAIPDAIIGANHWLVLGLTDLVEPGNDWCNEVGSESTLNVNQKISFHVPSLVEGCSDELGENISLHLTAFLQLVHVKLEFHQRVTIIK